MLHHTGNLNQASSGHPTHVPPYPKSLSEYGFHMARSLHLGPGIILHPGRVLAKNLGPDPSKASGTLPSQNPKLEGLVPKHSLDSKRKPRNFT